MCIYLHYFLGCASSIGPCRSTYQQQAFQSVAKGVTKQLATSSNKCNKVPMPTLLIPHDHDTW